MDPQLYELHLRAGQICGRRRTCGRKRRFEAESAAQRAVDAHNHWPDRSHYVEPYPCAFCGEWHLGRVMSAAELQDTVERREGKRR